MAIHVQCSQCDAEHHVNDRFAGRQVRCPQCEALVDVPEREPEMEPVADDGVVGDADDMNSLGDPTPANDLSAQEELADKQAVATDPAAVPVAVVGEDDEDDEVPKRQPRQDDELDMTPMVDVTFLLLIFFMVTASFSLQKSIEMPRQQTDAPSSNPDPEETEELDSVEVQIDDRGSFLVMAADWERETPGKQNLISALREAVPGGSDAMKLVIKVHEMAKLQALVDAMDAGTIAGYTELQVTQVEEFD